MRIFPDAATLRAARLANMNMRDRDFARIHEAAEGELVAAFVGYGNVRLNADLPTFLPRISELGTVMALTRNEAAVHEKIGAYSKVSGKDTMLVLDPNIDLRIFTSHWKHAFAVVTNDGGTTKRSFQFFDGKGEAVHKIHLKPQSNIEAFDQLTLEFSSENQSDEFGPLTIAPAVDDRPDSEIDTRALISGWEGMTDVHQFFGLLKKLGVGRHQALRLVDNEKAWRLDPGSVEAMLSRSAEIEVPIMCFVGSAGCIQIHSGPVKSIKTMGPWLNIMDETFHLHLHLDMISSLWAVRKPGDHGFVTSVEAYDEQGHLIIQFFGKRKEGQGERSEWRNLVETLHRENASVAA